MVTNRYSQSSFLVNKYLRKWCKALTERYTILSLFPLPITFILLSCMFISDFFMLAISDNLHPVEYIVSTKARSRRVSQDSLTISNSSTDKPLGNRFGFLGGLTLAAGSLRSNSSLTSHAKNVFNLESLLSTVLIIQSLL